MNVDAIMNQNTAQWDELYGAHSGVEYPHEQLVIYVSRLKQKPSPTLRALELGFGTIADLAMLSRKGYEAHGLEVSANAVERGRMKAEQLGLPIQLKVWEPGPLPFDDDHFDLFTSSGAIHYNLDQDAILSEVRRVLKPGGRLYATYLAPGHHFLDHVEVVDPTTRRFTETHPVPLMRGMVLRCFTTREELLELYGRHFAEVDVTPLDYEILGKRDVYWVVTATA